MSLNIIPVHEWLPVFENIEGCPNIWAYFRTLAAAFEDDPRRSSDGVVFLQPLTKAQANEQQAGLLEYFAESPEDWEYTSAEELRADIERCPLIQPSDECWLALDVDFSLVRNQEKSKAAIHAQAKSRREELDSANFKLEMGFYAAQGAREQEEKRRRLRAAIRCGNSRLALRLAALDQLAS